LRRCSWSKGEMLRNFGPIWHQDPSEPIAMVRSVSRMKTAKRILKSNARFGLALVKIAFWVKSHRVVALLT
jgi:hypothetical protein